MADIALTQAEADALIAMEKHRATNDRHDFPMRGESLTVPLQSPDKREHFLLDLSRGRIDLLKVKMQNRGRQVFVLVRLDLGGPPHRNPDDTEVPAPHLHVYREGYGDKWAVPVPAERFSNPADLWVTLEEFMRFCNVTQPPHIERGLFT
ncbi:MAG TPA: hypothetical protein VNM24_02690 [Burkholderiales bacterium]|nr:hypothetical protein [Burkholderiales bacterium]